MYNLYLVSIDCPWVKAEIFRKTKSGNFMVDFQQITIVIFLPNPYFKSKFYNSIPIVGLEKARLIRNKQTPCSVWWTPSVNYLAIKHYWVRDCDVCPLSCNCTTSFRRNSRHFLFCVDYQEQTTGFTFFNASYSDCYRSYLLLKSRETKKLHWPNSIRVST